MVMDHFLHVFLFTLRIAAIYTGWWYTYPSEKYDVVSWDDDIPIYDGTYET